MANDVVYGKKRTKTALSLIEKLKKYSQEKDFILGVLSNVPNEEDKKSLLNYIDNGKDVSYENIILYALDLGLQRDNKSH